VTTSQNQVQTETTEKSDYYVGRQPILDTSAETVGYELLFRSGEQNFADIVDGKAATETVFNSVMNVMGLHSLVGQGKAFINITKETLLDSTYRILPNDRVVIELLEDIEPTEEILKACQRLKKQGYTLALDDFAGREDYHELLMLADIVKVDFMGMTDEERKAVTERLQPYDIQLLAEKIETAEEVKLAKDLGYSFFQGYFYQKPVVIKQQSTSPAREACLRLLQVVNSESSGIKEIEDAIKRDLMLTTRLLCYINSAYFGLRSQVTSIAHGLKLLGLLQLRKWSTLVAIEKMTEGHPKELACDCLTRGLFCERLKQLLPNAQNGLDLFMTGMLSLIDTLTNQSKDEIVEKLCLKPEVNSALLGEDGLLGDALSLAVACEKFDHQGVHQVTERLDIDPNVVLELHQSAVQEAFKLAA
jgi:EAL and modified HD-GYP domain-containing signal transduction protein